MDPNVQSHRPYIIKDNVAWTLLKIKGFFLPQQRFYGIIVLPGLHQNVKSGLGRATFLQLGVRALVFSYKQY